MTGVVFLARVLGTGCHRILRGFLPLTTSSRPQTVACCQVERGLFCLFIGLVWGPVFGGTQGPSVLLVKASQSCWLVVLCCPFLSVWILKWKPLFFSFFFFLHFFKTPNYMFLGFAKFLYFECDFLIYFFAWGQIFRLYWLNLRNFGIWYIGFSAVLGQKSRFLATTGMEL